MAIKISGTVKFRFLFITLGTVPVNWIIPLPMQANPIAGFVIGKQLAVYNEHGINLVAAVGQV